MLQGSDCSVVKPRSREALPVLIQKQDKVLLLRFTTLLVYAKIAETSDYLFGLFTLGESKANGSCRYIEDIEYSIYVSSKYKPCVYHPLLSALTLLTALS